MASIMSITNIFDKEPKRKNRWTLFFADIPGETGAATGTTYGNITTADFPELNPAGAAEINPTGNPVDALELSLFSAQRPNYSLQEIEHHRLNEKYFLPGGKAEFQPMEVVFYDTIELNAGKILFNWMSAVYNPHIGSVGYKTSLSTIGVLYMLDPLGNIVEGWKMSNMWPKDINFGDLSYDSMDAAQVTVSFRYDYARKLIDSDFLPDTSETAWAGIKTKSFLPAG